MTQNEDLSNPEPPPVATGTAAGNGDVASRIQLASPKPVSWFGKFFKLFGPGLVTGAADDDPSGIATYSQVGAQFGYSLLWTMPFIYPFMASIQQISAQLGRVSGRGIAGNIKLLYPRWILYGIGPRSEQPLFAAFDGVFQPFTILLKLSERCREKWVCGPESEDYCHSNTENQKHRFSLQALALPPPGRYISLVLTVQ